MVGVWMGYDDNSPLTGVTGGGLPAEIWHEVMPVSYTHLRAHETVLALVCRLLLEKKKQPLAKSTCVPHDK